MLNLIKKIPVGWRLGNSAPPFLALKLSSGVQLHSQMQMCESRRPHDAEQAIHARAVAAWPSLGGLRCTQIYAKGGENGVLK